MDKTWMSKDKRSNEYEDGVEQFIEFATSHAANPKFMQCPCQVCGNLMFETPKGIRNHMFRRGIDQSYKIWSWHGEVAGIGRTSSEVKFDQSSKYEEVQETVEMVNAAYEHDMRDPNSFRKLLEDARKPLYPTCQNYTKLSSLMELYNIKGKHGISDQCFSELLSSLGKMFPVNNEVPSSMYEAKKTMIALGLEYAKIRACPNDCILYRKEYKDLSSCPVCSISRWKTKMGSSVKKRK